MKFTNSSSNNTHHIVTLTGTLTVITFGLILLVVSNDPCNKGMSAKELLRRRLATASEELFQTKYLELKQHEADTANLIATVESKKQTIASKKVEEKLLHEDLRTLNSKQYNLMTDETFFKKSNPDAESRWFTSYGWPALFTISPWILYAVYGAGVGEQQVDMSSWGCGCGIVTTLGLIMVLLHVLSSRGGNITRHFGSGSAGNVAIVGSSMLLLFTGCGVSFIPLSTEEGISHLTFVFGALAVGTVFMLVLLKFLKPKAESNTMTYVAVAALSLSMSTGVGMAFLFEVNIVCLGLMAGAVLIGIVWCVCKAYLQCRE